MDKLIIQGKTSRFKLFVFTFVSILIAEDFPTGIANIQKGAVYFKYQLFTQLVTKRLKLYFQFLPLGNAVKLPESIPTISKVNCGVSDYEFDECFSMGHPGSMNQAMYRFFVPSSSYHQDTILLKQLNGHKLQKGHLRNDPSTMVYAVREAHLPNTVQVCLH